MNIVMTKNEKKLKAIEQHLKEFGGVMHEDKLKALQATAKELKEAVRADQDKRFIRALNEEHEYLPSYRQHEAHPLANINVI